VYTDELTGRIRLLEDKLNVLDYENHVLREQLQRAGQSVGDGGGRSRESARPQRITPRPERPESTADSEDESDVPPPDLDLDIDLGTPVPPETNTPELSIGEPGERLRQGPAEDGNGAEADPESGSAMPPVQPLPPRQRDLEPPPIDPGEPLPPDSDNAQPALPPGRIETPESARTLFPLPPNPPQAAKIHAGLTGTHHHDSDQQVDGLYLTLSLLDADGQPTEVPAQLSVVVLDPAREGADARLGRWEFSVDQVAAARREHPLPSIQLPVLWQEKVPAGEEVALFVRFTLPKGDQLQTDMMIPLRQPEVAQWQPQGLGTPHFERGKGKAEKGSDAEKGSGVNSAKHPQGRSGY
jgi:hypothetical protein